MSEKELKKIKINNPNQILTKDLIELYNDQNIISFGVNNEGKLWKFTKKGYEFTNQIFKSDKTKELINRVASEVDKIININNPVLFVKFSYNRVFEAAIFRMNGEDCMVFEIRRTSINDI